MTSDNPGEIMIYHLSNVLISQSQLQFMTIEGFATESVVNPVLIELTNGSITNSTLKGKDSFILFNKFIF